MIPIVNSSEHTDRVTELSDPANREVKQSNSMKTQPSKREVNSAPGVEVYRELRQEAVAEDIKSELAWPTQEGPVSFKKKKKDAAHQPLTYSTPADLDLDT